MTDLNGLTLSLEKVGDNVVVKNFSHMTFEEKKSFCDHLQMRVKRAENIARFTALRLGLLAKNRKILSAKHLASIKNDEYATFSRFREWEDCKQYGNIAVDILQIAEENADKIFAELPSVKKVLSVLDTESFQDLTTLESLKQKIEGKNENLVELNEPLDLKDYKGRLVDEFLKDAKIIIKKKEKLIKELRDLKEEHNSLDIKISKKLFKGIPGLSDAILNAINSLLEKRIGLRAFERKAIELVKFGEYKDATEILNLFKNDEVQISDNVKAVFDEALSKLKISKQQLKKINS